MTKDSLKKESETATGREASVVERIVMWLKKRRYYYMVYTDFDEHNISIRMTKQSDLEYMKRVMPTYNFIECGAITYWLMAHSMPKLAMLSFWD